MNKLTSRQRKMAYAGGVLVLLVPIVFLGAPATQDVQPGAKATASGGMLARMRVEQDLGESTLGDIDPSSAAMNLVLLGLRGPAVSLLHQNAIGYQEHKDWGKLKTTVDSIIRLQPHYIKIWQYQGWNLAFNVSREWDKVEDRYFWVKEGLKFLKDGTDRNQTATILFHNLADFMGRKIGSADEKKFFRNFFLHDPDPQFEGGADPVLNPDGKDNYLAAYDNFVKANEKDDAYGVSGMTYVFFRQGPARALLDYAAAFQADGPDYDTSAAASDADRQAREEEAQQSFATRSRDAWDNAYRDWTEVYGKEVFRGLNDIRYRLNSTEEELEADAKTNGVTLEQQRRVWLQNQDMTHYRFWTAFADCERDPVMVDAHRAIYEGKRAFARGETSDPPPAEDGTPQVSRAEELFFEGMTRFEEALGKYPDLAFHQDYIEEAMLAVYYWEKVHQFNGKRPPEEFPLKKLSIENAGKAPEIELQFFRENRAGF
ncbi:MAG: hypothetical protein R3C19_07500 [Planctomycetaceae bacterium]